MIAPLNLPKAPLRLTRKDGEIFVWCEVRRKKLLCTPEEWVRQHVIHYLNSVHSAPFSLMSAEHRISYNGREKRADIVLFSRDGTAELIVECKAPDVVLSKETLFQIAQYQSGIKAQRLMLTNGIKHYFMQEDEGEMRFVEGLSLKGK